MGHASLLVQTGGRNILIDPVWSERVSPFAFAGPKRVNAPGVAFGDYNGMPSVAVSLDGEIDQVTSLEIADGRVRAVYAVRNPAKLTRIRH